MYAYVQNMYTENTRSAISATERAQAFRGLSTSTAGAVRGPPPIVRSVWRSPLLAQSGLYVCMYAYSYDKEAEREEYRKRQNEYQRKFRKRESAKKEGARDIEHMREQDRCSLTHTLPLSLSFSLFLSFSLSLSLSLSLAPLFFPPFSVLVVSPMHTLSLPIPLFPSHALSLTLCISKLGQVTDLKADMLAESTLKEQALSSHCIQRHALILECEQRR